MTLAVKHPWFWFVLLAFTFLLVFHFAANSAAAQAVQLPTFNNFTVSTTVVVPDRGTAYLGGIGRSSSGRTSQGIPGLPGRPFTNTATGRNTGASNMSVTAEIHDLEAMDRALLAGDTLAARPNVPWRLPPQVAQQTNSKAASTVATSQNKPSSIAALQAQNVTEDAVRARSAAAALARGRELLAAGKTGVAKIYFQDAARNGSGETKQQALAALESLAPAKSPKIAER